MTLSDLKLNDRAKILNIRDGRIKSRLFDMGIKIGKIVTVFAIAPFGTPLAIKCGNIRLAIAKSAAEVIAVNYVE